MEIDPKRHRLRVGRKVLRTIYVHDVLRPLDEDSGVFIGCVDTPEIAQLIVESVNERLCRLQLDQGAIDGQGMQ